MRKESFLNTPINAVINMILIPVIAFVVFLLAKSYVENSSAYYERKQKAFYECTNLSKALYCVDITTKNKHCLYDNYECVITTGNPYVDFKCQTLDTKEEFSFYLL